MHISKGGRLTRRDNNLKLMTECHEVPRTGEVPDRGHTFACGFVGPEQLTASPENWDRLTPMPDHSANTAANHNTAANQNAETNRNVDTEFRRLWQGGNRTSVEEFLRRHPEVACQERQVLDLIYAEFLLRSRGRVSQPARVSSAFSSA